MKKSSLLKQVFVLTLVLAFIIPTFAFAASCPSRTAGAQPSDFDDFVCLLILDIIDPLTGVLMGVALLVFFWGVAKMIYKSGDEKALGEGKKFLLWGVIAMFILISVWGILHLFYSDLFGDSGFGFPQLPE